MTAGGDNRDAFEDLISGYAPREKGGLDGSAELLQTLPQNAYTSPSLASAGPPCIMVAMSVVLHLTGSSSLCVVIPSIERWHAFSEHATGQFCHKAPTYSSSIG